MIRFWPILLFAVLVACAPGEKKVRHVYPPEETLLWPPPPQEARIRYLYAFHEPADLGFQQSFIEGLWKFLAGEALRGMVRPYAIAAQGDSVAIADPGLGVLHLYNMKEKTYKRIEKVAGEKIVSPVGVAMGPDRIYFVDSTLEKIFILDRDGTYRRTVTGLKRPTGVAYHRETGRLYVADTLDHRISVFNAEGNPLFNFGARGGEPGKFNYPTHITLSGSTLYVNDTMNFRVQTFDLDGKFLSSFGKIGDGSGFFAQPKGVGVDAEGHVYVVDALFNRIQIFDPSGVFLLAFGAQGKRAGEFWLPAGVFIDNNKIFVADSYNQRVQVFEFLETKS